MVDQDQKWVMTSSCVSDYISSKFPLTGSQIPHFRWKLEIHAGWQMNGVTKLLTWSLYTYTPNNSNWHT